MSLDRGGIQRQRHRIVAQLGQRLEDRTPSVALGPAVEAIIDRRVRAVFPWAVAPAPARLQHVDDAADDPTIVRLVSLGTGQAARQMPLERLPLSVVQPEQAVPYFPLRESPALDMRLGNHRSTIMPVMQHDRNPL